MMVSTYPENLRPISLDNVHQIREVGSIAVPDGTIRGLRYSPDSKYLAVLVDNELILWDVQTAMHHLSFPHYAFINSAAFSADGKYLLTNSKSMHDPDATGSELHCWNVETGEEIYTWKPSVGFADAIAFNPQNPSIVALMSYERNLRTLTNYPDPRVKSVIDTSNIGIELWDGQNLMRRVVDFIDREGMHRLEHRLLAFSRDGKTLYGCVNGDGDKQHRRWIVAWEVLGDNNVRSLTESSEYEYVESFTLNQQETYLAFRSLKAHAGQVTVRHLLSDKVVYHDTVNFPHYIDFDREGDILVVGRLGSASPVKKVVDLVNVKDGKLIRQLHVRALRPALAFSPDNRSLAIEMYEDELSDREKIVLWGIPQ
jgi:hypothetical protein